MKPKALRKLIQQHFKKVAVLSELECMYKFFDLLRAHYRFDQERFICALGVSSLSIVACLPYTSSNSCQSSLILTLSLVLFTVELVYTRGTSHRTGFRHILHGSQGWNGGRFITAREHCLAKMVLEKNR